MATPDCVIALSFGYQVRKGERLPGLSNEALAEILASEYEPLPKVLQFEVADAFAAISDEPIMRIEKTDTYLDTHGVIERAAAICAKSKWRTVALVAHPVHLPRVAAVALHAGLQVSDEQLARMRAHSVPFDPASEQSWTRSESAARAHELGANLVYKILDRA